MWVARAGSGIGNVSEDEVDSIHVGTGFQMTGVRVLLRRRLVLVGEGGESRHYLGWEPPSWRNKQVTGLNDCYGREIK